MYFDGLGMPAPDYVSRSSIALTVTWWQYWPKSRIWDCVYCQPICFTVVQALTNWPNNTSHTFWWFRKKEWSTWGQWPIAIEHLPSTYDTVLSTISEEVISRAMVFELTISRQSCKLLGKLLRCSIIHHSAVHQTTCHWHQMVAEGSWWWESFC